MLDIVMIEARMERVLDRVIPIYYKDTPERRKDCASERGIKNYQRQLLRIKMARDNNLIDEYEKQLNIEP